MVDEHEAIIAGHGRLDAARKLGMAEVPTITLTGLSDEQKRALVLADNQLALNAGWDAELLALELGELGDAGFDLSLVGFSDEELAAILADTTEGLTDPDDVPEAPADPVSVLGDVWTLGRHRLVCGDATARSDIEILTAGIVPDLANCDPPYGINVVRGGSISGAKPFGKVGGGKPHPFAGRVHGRARNAIIEPGIYAPIIGDDTTETAIAAYHMLTDLGVPAIVMWGGNYFADALPASRCWLVWDKENTGSFADCELAWTNQDAIARLFRHQWSGLIKASERGERRVHPTQKPSALADWVSETVNAKAETVIDLFLGSGATLISAERTKRTMFGMELSPAYVDVALLRWQAFTGQQATHASTGATFSETQDERAKVAA